MTPIGNILITGGSGTLGHAIVRTAQQERWDCHITIYSRSELRQAQMRAQHPDLRYVLGDVRDYERLAAAVTGHDLVIHAAAMKRIPECEANPPECYATNVTGSLNVVRACQQSGVARCVGVSTDKACRAVTAYGASKLAMEKLFQAQPAVPTIFTLVRYGNVVASNGSVIPVWREQVRRGESLTVTDREMTRFWMAPGAAVQLVIEASKLASGLIVVPKMGALSIAELAGIVAPGAPLRCTGLRSIEKTHEDLVHPDELAQELPAGWIVGTGEIGRAYRSDMAPRLSPGDFLAMLNEAETYQ